VFNFFKPGYTPSSSTLSAGAVAPEFQLVNESSVGGYLNYMMDTIRDGINRNSDMRAAYTAEMAVAVISSTDASPRALVNRVNLLLCAGDLSPTTVDDIVAEVAKLPSASADNKRMRVCVTVLMTMACAEYLIQK
jgi:hypothetical protein